MVDTLQSAQDIMPVVPRKPASRLMPWLFAVVLALGGFSLFNALNANRMAAEVARTAAPGRTASGTITSPPMLRLPGDFSRDGDQQELGQRDERAGSDTDRPTGRRGLRGNPMPPLSYLPPEPIAEPAPILPPQQLVDDYLRDRSAADENSASNQAADPDRVTARRFLNPSLTVPKGTVIPAVLETALDSTRPGAARGLVQRDIFGFDGSRILIPRGSRLYGEYEADLSSGQRRAAIRWTRLLRPDGVLIDLDSPASDPQGRSGVEGKVDSKFFQRFGGAILQSILDVGVALAAREATNGIIVALPGSNQNVRVAEPETIKPTLKIRQGTSVSVFVAKDLDFSTVDA